MTYRWLELLQYNKSYRSSKSTPADLIELKFGCYVIKEQVFTYNWEHLVEGIDYSLENEF